MVHSSLTLDIDILKGVDSSKEPEDAGPMDVENDLPSQVEQDV